MKWFVGWRIDKDPPEKILALAENPEKAFAALTQNGLCIGKLCQKLFGPYDSEKEALAAEIPPPIR